MQEAIVLIFFTAAIMILMPDWPPAILAQPARESNREILPQLVAELDNHRLDRKVLSILTRKMNFTGSAAIVVGSMRDSSFC